MTPPGWSSSASPSWWSCAVGWSRRAGPTSAPTSCSSTASRTSRCSARRRRWSRWVHVVGIRTVTGGRIMTLATSSVVGDGEWSQCLWYCVFGAGNDSKRGKGSTWVEIYKVNGDALWRWFVNPLPGQGKSSVCIGIGRNGKDTTKDHFRSRN